MTRFIVKIDYTLDMVFVTIWDTARNECALHTGESKFIKNPGFIDTMLHPFTFREVNLKQKVRKAMYKMQLRADKMNENEWEYTHAERLVKELIQESVEENNNA